MNGFRKDALLRTLKEEYGIATMEQLYDAMRKMKKLDITQFVAAPQTKGEKICTRQHPQPTTGL